MQNLVLQVKREIQQDADKGLFPKTVKSFSDLHDYIDANEYLIRVHEATGKKRMIDNLNLFNRITAEVDKWLDQGSLLPDFNDEIIALQRLINEAARGNDPLNITGFTLEAAHEVARNFMEAWNPKVSMSLDEFLADEEISEMLPLFAKVQARDILNVFESI